MTIKNYDLEEENFILAQRLANARTILRDVLDNISEIDETSELTKEELLAKVIVAKKILCTYEDDYTYRLESERCADLFLDRPMPVEYDKKAEAILNRIGNDYKKYVACIHYNKTKFGDKNKFQYYGMSGTVFRAIKADLELLRNIGKDNREFGLYIKNVCLEGMSVEMFATQVLNKKSKSNATYIKKKLLEKIADTIKINDQCRGTAFNQKHILKSTTKIMTKVDEIEALALAESNLDTERYYQILGREWAKYEEEQLTEQEMRKQQVAHKRWTGKECREMDEDGSISIIDTKIDDLNSCRDDYADLLFCDEDTTKSEN